VYFAILNGPVKSQSDCIIMHEELWAGPDLKLEYAEFHLERMGQSLEPPERTHGNVALEASGAILATKLGEIILSTSRCVFLDHAEYSRDHSMLLWCGLGKSRNEGLV